jgi:hypothetical protein
MKTGDVITVDHCLKRRDGTHVHLVDRRSYVTRVWDVVKKKKPQQVLFLGHRTLSNGVIRVHGTYEPHNYFKALLVIALDGRTNPFYVKGVVQ